MFVIKEFCGDVNLRKWQGVKFETYPQPDLAGVSKQVLTGAGAEGASFEVRYYHFDVGSKGDLARHDREYCFYVLHGRANLLVNEDTYSLQPNDVVYISPNELIQVTPEGNEPLGFLCITTS